jgi:para-nitrobenzyl esterase
VQGLGEGNVRAFYAIPYAHAERWRSPAVATLNGPFQATTPPARCAQRDRGTDYLDEDCLVLTIRTPSSGAGPLPVFVFIHGSGWRFAAPEETGPLAARGAVVVAIQYRLGTFGYAYHEALGGANYGLQDQIAALRWVQQNISAFGGDPDNVTIGGFSFGASAVANLLASPASRPGALYHRAIAHSQFPSPRLVVAPAEAQALVGTPLEKALHCDGAADVESCLRGKTTTEILDAGAGPIFMIDVADGVTLEGDSYELLRLRGAPVPTLVGMATRDSNIPLDPSVPLTDAFDQVVDAVYGAGQVAAYEALYPAASYTDPGDRLDALIDGSILSTWYPGIEAQLIAAHPAASYPDPRDRLNDLFNDSFACLKQQIAVLMSEVRGSSPIYFYMFAYHLPDDIAYHGFDQFFLFGTPPPGLDFTAAEEAFLADYQTTWVRFMQTGKPKGGFPKWPPLDAEQRYMTIDLEPTVQAGGYHPAACDAIAAPLSACQDPTCLVDEFGCCRGTYLYCPAGPRPEGEVCSIHPPRVCTASGQCR